MEYGEDFTYFKIFFPTFKQRICCFLLLVSAIGVKAQEYNLQGVILDEQTGAFVIGAQVKVKSSSTGTTSGLNGNFQLTVKVLPVTLQVSYIVYKAQELTVSDRQSLRILLKPVVNVLDEVVVVGYNTARRGSFTGSASRIVTDYGKNYPVQSFDQLLVGKASGVNISLPNGVEQCSGHSYSWGKFHFVEFVSVDCGQWYSYHNRRCFYWRLCG